MSSQMLRQEIRRLAGPNVLLADSPDELRNQLSLLQKGNDHGQEAETQGSQTGTEETQEDQEVKEEKTEKPEESPSGQEGSKDS